MIERKRSYILLYAAMLTFFFLDLVSFSLYEKPIVYSLLGFYILYTIPRMQYSGLICNTLLLLLLNFFYQGRLLSALAYIIPTLFLSLQAQNYLDDHPAVRYALLVMIMIFNAVLINGYLYDTPIDPLYTFIQITATLVVMLSFSLIYKYRQTR